MRMPGLASITDAARNMYGMFNLGFNPKDSSIPMYGTPLNKQLSVGGMMTFGGLAVAGAGMGAALGSQMEGDMIAPMALGGAAAGALALPALGLTANLGLKAGGAAIKGIGSAAIKAPGVAMRAAPALMGIASPIASTMGSTAVGFGSMMVDWDRIKKSETLLGSVQLTGIRSGFMNGVKAGLSGFEEASALGKAGKVVSAGGQGLLGSIVNGKTVLGAASVIKGAAGAMSEVNRIHMGQMDGMVRTPTVGVPSYMDNAGATGDLVFAMNANRRG